MIEDDPKDALMGAVGKKVREARDRHGLTRAQFAEMTGLASSYIFELETEGANITLKTLEKLAESLKLGPRDLLPESEHDALTASGAASLIAVLDRVAKVLEHRQSEEAELIAELRRFGDLRHRVEGLASKRH